MEHSAFEVFFMMAVSTSLILITIRMWAEQMQKYKVSMEWKSGFKTTHHHHGSEKSVLMERKFLDALQYLSKYKIVEVKFKGWQIVVYTFMEGVVVGILIMMVVHLALDFLIKKKEKQYG